MNTYEEDLVMALKAAGLTLSTAESCTGGMIAERITSVAGASAVFESGAVTYSNNAKEKLVGVKKETLEKYGAVSSQTALEMCEGVRGITGAQIGVSVTGLAGPTGDEGKPVGLVYVGVSSPYLTQVLELHLSGDREAIRKASADKALTLAKEAVLAYNNKKDEKDV